MDRGQRETEAILKQIEKRINQEYKQAIDEIEDQLSDYLRRFEIKDKKWQEWVESGYKTEDQYKKWRMQQMAVGQKWSEQKEQIAYELAHVNETAKSLARMAAPEIFAENANYSTFKIEKDAKIDTGFTLYSRESVAELIANDPEVLPPVGKKVARDIAMGKAVKWNRQQLQSVMMQGILQGDSIPKLATRLANTVGDRDRKAAIRNARTMATAAQNAGREQSYKDAQSKGIELEQMWIATLDGRTRHSHRWLDGERKPVGEPFSNGCRYPADPEGAPAEIYNCRCTLRAVVKGLERRSGQFRDTSGMDGMTYDQWRDAKATSNPIDLPEQKANAIKQSYINEYRGGGRRYEPNKMAGGQEKNTGESGIIKPQSEAYTSLMESLNNFGKTIEHNPVSKLSKKLSESEIISRISGGDMTKGSCSSLTYAYIGNKHGLDVLDFRGGASQDFFSTTKNEILVNQLEGVKTQTFFFDKEASQLAKKLKELDLEKGKEYRLSCGKHAAIIRNTDNGYEYLELQNATRSGWHSFTKKDSYKAVWDDQGLHLVPQEVNCSMADKLHDRFGCRKTASNRPILGDDGKLVLDADGRMVFGERVQLTEVDSFKDNEEFKTILGYINTDESKQKKGASGGEK